MKVQFIGYSKFKQAKKDDPSKIYTGIYLFGITPIDSDTGEGHKTVTLTVWDDKISKLIPNGPASLIKQLADVYYDKWQNVEVIALSTK